MNIQLAEDLVPAARFKNQQAAILRRLRESGRTIVITQRGVAAAVVMTPEEYDRLTERIALLEALGAGARAEQAGRLVEHEEAVRRLEAVARRVE
jgi:prevent-host-death family protein